MHLSTMSLYCCDQTKYTVKYLVLLIDIHRPNHSIRSRLVLRSVREVVTDDTSDHCHNIVANDVL